MIIIIKTAKKWTKYTKFSINKRTKTANSKNHTIQSPQSKSIVLSISPKVVLIKEQQSFMMDTMAITKRLRLFIMDLIIILNVDKGKDIWLLKMVMMVQGFSCLLRLGLNLDLDLIRLGRIRMSMLFILFVGKLLIFTKESKTMVPK